MRRKKYAWQAAPKKKIFVGGKVTIGTESDDESTTSTSDDDGKEGDDKEEAMEWFEQCNCEEPLMNY